MQITCNTVLITFYSMIKQCPEATCGGKSLLSSHWEAKAGSHRNYEGSLFTDLLGLLAYRTQDYCPEVALPTVG